MGSNPLPPIGTPLNDGTWIYTWERGRQLKSMSNGTTTWNMTYDADGMRTSRTNGTNTYYYYYESGLLTYMKYNSLVMRFTYDAQSNPVSMTYNGNTYFYALNLQGDVMALLDADGNEVVSYHYNGWGKLINTTASSTGMLYSLALYNPLRYRSYVYDRETGLYYLQSRYYNPTICRFISADDVSLIGANDAVISHNLYAYCSNNPVTRADDEGHFWHLILGAVIGVASQYISDVVTNLSQGKSFTESLVPTSTLADYAAAGLSGAIAATGIGFGASVAVNAAISGATYVANSHIHGEEVNLEDLSLTIGIGAIAGMVGGSGADGANLRGIAKTSREMLKTVVSKKKIAMYSTKIMSCGKTAIISGARTMAAGFTANGLNFARRGVTGSAF